MVGHHTGGPLVRTQKERERERDNPETTCKETQSLFHFLAFQPPPPGPVNEAVLDVPVLATT